MSDDWTALQDRIAQAEGWCLSERSDGYYEIQKCDGSARFDTDQKALEYVRERARKGGFVHQRALRLDREKVKP